MPSIVKAIFSKAGNAQRFILTSYAVLNGQGGNTRLLVLETKGKHLDNDDTAFKRRVYEILEQAYQSVGFVDPHDKQADDIRFEILMQTDEKEAWKPNLEAALT